MKLRQEIFEKVRLTAMKLLIVLFIERFVARNSWNQPRFYRKLTDNTRYSLSRFDMHESWILVPIVHQDTIMASFRALYCIVVILFINGCIDNRTIYSFLYFYMRIHAIYFQTEFNRNYNMTFTCVGNLCIILSTCSLHIIYIYVCHNDIFTLWILFKAIKLILRNCISGH